MTHVLVTGAAGFIGAHVVRAALARGLTVTALGHRSAAPVPGAHTIQADLVSSDLAALLGRLKPTAIVNAASYGVGADERDPDRMLAVNCTATGRLLSAARHSGVSRFLQLGTYSEYGDHPEPIDEQTPLAPKEGYGATKAAASLLVAAPGLAGSVETIVLRLFNVWGPGERPHRLLPQVIRHCRAGTRFPLTPGDQVKDWSFVRDVAEWIVDILLQPAPWPDPIVNVASGQRFSVRDVATRTARKLGGEHLLDFGAVPVPAREVQTGPADLTRIDALLPARRITAFEDALAMTIAETPS